MGVWGDRLLPRLLDSMGAAPEITRLRAEVCAGLHGTVLELGFGSGLNVPHYPAAVTEVLAVEPSDAAWALSERRRAESAVPVRRSGLDGQRLTEADDSVDCVLSTLTLCTIPDVAARAGGGTAGAAARRHPARVRARPGSGRGCGDVAAPPRARCRSGCSEAAT